MTPSNVVAKLVALLNDPAVGETPFNNRTDEDAFEELRERLQSDVLTEVEVREAALGTAYACEQAMVALLHRAHRKHGTQACLAIIKELASALDAYDESARCRSRSA